MAILATFIVGLVNYTTIAQNSIIKPISANLTTKSAIGQTATKDSDSKEIKTKEVWLKQSEGTWAKSYMDYTMITDKTSKQWKYIQESGHVKIDKKGFLICDDEYIGVALGSWFGKIGTKYIFTLENGKQIKVCKVESKADIDTCADNYLADGGHIIEFVIDTNTKWMQNHIWDNGYIFNGNFNNYKKFKGEIVKVEKVIN